MEVPPPLSAESILLPRLSAFFVSLFLFLVLCVRCIYMYDMYYYTAVCYVLFVLLIFSLFSFL